jgi:ketosteroid isomerase-like protein
MSEENVEIVKRLQPFPDMDIAETFRDDEMWAAVAGIIAPFFHADCQIVPPGVPGTETIHTGLDGLRAAWLEWLEPWVTYRTEIKQALDAGDRVLLLTQDYGRNEQAAPEVKLDGSAVWTISDGRIARAEFFPDRSEAFAAVGLAE